MNRTIDSSLSSKGKNAVIGNRSLTSLVKRLCCVSFKDNFEFIFLESVVVDRLQGKGTTLVARQMVNSVSGFIFGGYLTC